MPEGEDGQANLDAGKKLRVIYFVGIVVLGVMAIIVLANQLEGEAEKLE